MKPPYYVSKHARSHTPIPYTLNSLIGRTRPITQPQNPPTSALTHHTNHYLSPINHKHRNALQGTRCFSINPQNTFNKQHNNSKRQWLPKPSPHRSLQRIHHTLTAYSTLRPRSSPHIAHATLPHLISYSSAQALNHFIYGSSISSPPPINRSVPAPGFSPVCHHLHQVTPPGCTGPPGAVLRKCRGYVRPFGL